MILKFFLMVVETICYQIKNLKMQEINLNLIRKLDWSNGFYRNDIAYKVID